MPQTRVRIHEVNSVPKCTFKEKILFIIYLFTKRIVDIIVAIIGLAVTMPLFIIISAFYLFGENRGPVFFRQTRMGVNGKGFKLYKFRSMIVNAEEVLRLNEDLYKKYIKNSYKLAADEDPRITRVGRFLRKTSLDELPQLINLLKGDMSLIGPRPVIKEELKEYRERSSELLSVKPGVTGYWQVCGRSDIRYPERVNVELFYIYNQSFLFDVQIFVKTINVVFLKKGAR